MRESQGRVILAGGSGFLGRALAPELPKRGYEVVVLTRSPDREARNPREVGWDGKSLGSWVAEIDGAKAMVNLAGCSVNCRYTPENRREIIDSRVDSVRVVGEAIRRCARPPAVVVQAGSLAIYGDTREVCDENAPHGEGFSVHVCELWEEAFDSLALLRTRKVLLRIGFALGRGGGALEPLANLAKWFLGGRVGSGRQSISWIHVVDLNEMFFWAIEREDVQGVYNATGPNPVTNAEFMRELRRVLGRPWSPPVPAWAVKIGAWFMGTDPSLALTGRRCLPARFLEQGFTFAFPELVPALQDLLGRPTGEPR